MARPTHIAVYEEGPKAVKNFDGAMRKILAVSPQEIKQRIEAEQDKKSRNESIKSIQRRVARHLASRVPASS